MSFFVSKTLKDQITESMLDELESDSDSSSFAISFTCNNINYEVANFDSVLKIVNLYLPRNVSKQFLQMSKNATCTLTIFSREILKFNLSDMNILSYKKLTNDLIEIIIRINSEEI